jgi:hypothetical protein
MLADGCLTRLKTHRPSFGRSSPSPRAAPGRSRCSAWWEPSCFVGAAGTPVAGPPLGPSAAAIGSIFPQRRARSGLHCGACGSFGAGRSGCFPWGCSWTTWWWASWASSGLASSSSRRRSSFWYSVSCGPSDRSRRTQRASRQILRSRKPAQSLLLGETSRAPSAQPLHFRRLGPYPRGWFSTDSPRADGLVLFPWAERASGWSSVACGGGGSRWRSCSSD